jgi:uncharacterized membrane protein YphA (DoxX/SURF4 family)
MWTENSVKGGVEAFVNHASTLIPSWVPSNFGQMYLKSLPYLEIVLGGLLILGALTRLVSALLVLMLISFSIALGGVSGEKLGLPFHPNVIYLGLAAALVFCGGGRLSVDGLLFGPRRSVTITEKYTEPL